MRVLVDVVHPAHVHFYRHLIGLLEARGDEVVVVSRDKEVTVALLDQLGIPHTPVGRSAERSVLGHGGELLARDLALVRVGRRFRPDVILTRNPAGVQAATVLGTLGIFDSDDGTVAGIHWRAAAPFADVITTPSCLGESHGPRHWTYHGYKALAYLHPARFTPDPTVRTRLGVDEGELLSVVRFVAFHASHDAEASGLDPALRREVVDRLARRGRVVISSESPLPPDLQPLRLELPPTQLHHVLAAADLVVGDSHTVAAEAALLGTPVVRASTFTGRIPYLVELEDRYELMVNFTPDQGPPLLQTVDELARDPGTKARWGERRDRMLTERVDVTAWYLDLIDLLVARRRTR